MNSVEIRARLEAALTFQSERLARRIAPLKATSERLATLRLGIVVAAVVAVLGAALAGYGTWAWVLVVVALAIFIVVVLFHRRVERWIETLTLWRALKDDERARMNLDWEALPPPRPLELRDQGLARDLDLTGYRSLHQLLDTTLSRRGTNLLAGWLTSSRPDVPALEARQAIVKELAPRTRFRDRFQLVYRLVLHRELEGDNLLEWLKTDFPTRQLARALPIATVLVALNIVLFLGWYVKLLPPLWVISLVAYVAFYYYNHNALDTVLLAVVRVDAELDKFRAILSYLEKANYTGAPKLAELCAPFVHAANPPSARLKRVGRVTAAVGIRSNPLSAVVLNLVLPWDFIFAYFADRERRQVAGELPDWVRIVHELDALIALGNFAYLNPEANFPVIRENADSAVKPILMARGVGHPLILATARVCNDVQIDALGEVEILTGSNMAGKSTFLKTLGVNLCLGYAGAPVIADELVTLPFRLHTCIRITDSISDGFSYFYAEVKCLKQLLVELKADDPLPLLYFVDEIFRGTNNRERLIGSRAYIQALLGARGAGLIATHDLELAHLADANANARNFHFRDEVGNGRLVFDYKLRTGPCPTTNALKIMAMEGLPVEGRDEG